VEEAAHQLSKLRNIATTILVVEDHFMTRWAAARYLRNAGFKVVEAVDAQEAMGLAASGLPISAVFSDVSLGAGPRGDELADWFAKHRPSVPVLLTSGEDYTSQLPATQLRRFLRKPYSLAEVDDLLRKMLEAV
jgi:two-component system, response regulator PdtaR